MQRYPFEIDSIVVLMTFHFRLIRRECFEQAGGIDPYFESAIDYDLCLRLSEITQIKHLKVPLYEYRVHPRACLTNTAAVKCSMPKLRLKG